MGQATEEKPSICARQTKDEKRKLRDLSQKLRKERVFQGLGVVNTVPAMERPKKIRTD